MPIDTKQYISDHLTALLLHRNLEDITVKCLVEDCSISRQTFYYHFQDLMDVIQWNIRQSFEEALKKSLQAQDLNRAIGCFVEGASEKQVLLKKLLASPRRAEIERLILESVRSYLKELFREEVSRSALSLSDLNTLLCFYSYGIMGLLLEQNGSSFADRQKLTNQICRLISGRMIQEGRPQ